jgi:pimeloyl-ACP methyl ester carboxylesterase
VQAIPELAAGLGRIRCPTAVIWGERDPYIPVETARELVERIPEATLTSFPDGDHYIMEERPAEVACALLGLLARDCARAAPAVATSYASTDARSVR